jgi:hypothetical protein
MDLHHSSAAIYNRNVQFPAYLVNSEGKSWQISSESVLNKRIQKPSRTKHLLVCAYEIPENRAALWLFGLRESTKTVFAEPEQQQSYGTLPILRNV